MKRLFESIELEKMFIRIQWQTYGWTHACDRLCDHENHMWFRKYPLLLYLSISDSVFGCIFGQHDKTRKKERAMYYISKRFTPYKYRYTLLERACCALTWLAQKLRHYLSSYTTYLLSRMDPLKFIFQKAMSTGKLAKW